jgi:hypothetical protein
MLQILMSGERFRLRFRKARPLQTAFYGTFARDCFLDGGFLDALPVLIAARTLSALLSAFSKFCPFGVPRPVQAFHPRAHR